MSIRSWWERRKKRRKLVFVIGRVVRFRAKNWNVATEASTDTDRFFSYRRWSIGPAWITVERYLRGDVVEVSLINPLGVLEPVLKFADQSYQYNGLMGQNDIEFKEQALDSLYQFAKDRL